MLTLRAVFVAFKFSPKLVLVGVFRLRCNADSPAPVIRRVEVPDVFVSAIFVVSHVSFDNRLCALLRKLPSD